MDFSRDVLLKYVWVIYVFYIYLYTSPISFDISHIKDYGKYQRIFERIGKVTTIFSLLVIYISGTVP